MPMRRKSIAAGGWSPCRIFRHAWPEGRIVTSAERVIAPNRPRCGRAFMRRFIYLAAAVFFSIAGPRLPGADGPLDRLGPRTPWTTSNFHGRPDPPPPYRTELIFPN